MKLCPACRQILDVTCFYSNNATPSKLSVYCKECTKHRVIEYQSTERGKIQNRARVKAWRDRRPPQQHPQRKYPITHFERQADVYHRLLLLGYRVRGEYKIGNSRLDLIVFDDNDSPWFIIEIKKRKSSLTEDELAIRRKRGQIKKYLEICQTVYLHCVSDNLTDFIEMILNKHPLLHKDK